MTEKEIIKAWKINEKPFELVGSNIQKRNEMQDWAKQHRKLPWQLFCNGKWESLPNRLHSYPSDASYRLSPDYQPKPELIECEIKDDKCETLCGGLVPLCHIPFRRIIGNDHIVKFCGFKFADGTILLDYKRSKSRHDRKKPIDVEFAVKVLFWRLS